MTARDYRWLCQAAYIDLPEDGAGMRGKALGEIAGVLLAADAGGELLCGALSEAEREALDEIRRTEALRELTLLDYVNRNQSSGLAAYVLRSGDGEIHCIFRGSERQGCGVPSGIDWADNFLSPLLGSVQYEDVEAIVNRFRGRRITFSGHSKGAHNALYALARCGDGARALTFNGQGFARAQLSARERAHLRARGVNYVVCGDVVGLLLNHPERRVFVKKQGEGSAHALSAFSFDEKGAAVECARLPWTAVPEWAARAYMRVRESG